MPEVKLTEFIPVSFPNPRITREIVLPVSDAAYSKWEKVIKLGGRLTLEILSTNQINVCIEEPELGDFDMFICPNQMRIAEKLLDEMLASFNETDFNHWKSQMTEEGEDLTE